MIVSCHRLKVSTLLAQAHRPFVSNFDRRSLALELWEHWWNINLHDDLRGVWLGPGVNADWTRPRGPIFWHHSSQVWVCIFHLEWKFTEVRTWMSSENEMMNYVNYYMVGTQVTLMLSKYSTLLIMITNTYLFSFVT